MKIYYTPEDLKKFGKIGDFQKQLADKLFLHYKTFTQSTKGRYAPRESSSIDFGTAD